MTEFTLEQAQDRLAGMVREARRAVGFTGAGISTECGIPDFRSPGGFWTKYAPIYYDDFVRSEEARIEAWRRKFSADRAFAEAKPGRGHRALAHLVSVGRMAAIITQNIDNLHQASGVPADKVIELHGNGTYAACLDCLERHDLDWIRQRFEADGRPPPCGRCGGLVKTATISFGQAMPEDAVERAETVTRACDLMIAVGSSLVVYPAAGLPLLAKRAGARLAIVNRDPTDLDAAADLVIRHDIGDVLAPLARLN